MFVCQLGIISFITKLKRRELNPSERAYSSLRYMQTAQRAYSSHGCCSHLPSSGWWLFSRCPWAQHRHIPEKTSRWDPNGLGMTKEGQEARVRSLAVSHMWLFLGCCFMSSSEKFFCNVLGWILSRRILPSKDNTHFSYLIASEELPVSSSMICFLYLPLCHPANSAAFSNVTFFLPWRKY